VPRRAKWVASVMMVFSIIVIALAPMPLWLEVAVPASMLAPVAWPWRRPEP